MYIKINNKKLEIIELTTFWQRFKSLKFALEPITTGIKLPHKKYADTYLFCQRVDIVMTDKDNNILYLYKNVKTEKRILFKRKVYNVYYLPLNTVDNLEVNTRLKEYK